MNYLFLAVPPFCGSTVLHNYLANCSAVSSLRDPLHPEIGIVEGHAIINNRGHNYPLTPDINEEAVADRNNYDLVLIKSLWDDIWSENNPTATVRLQKTPSDIFRVKMLQEHWSGLRWIVSVRDPYAYAASFIEKRFEFGADFVEHGDNIARRIARTYEVQRANVEFLRDAAYVMTYEDFVANPDKHCAGIRSFMPEMADLSFAGNVLVKEKMCGGLISNNELRISRLKNIPGAINKLNLYLSQYEDSLNAWGYKLL